MLKSSFNGALVIREQGGRVFYEAKWRDSRGRQVKRRVGPAWLERDRGGPWRRHIGRVPDGCFDEKAAIVEMSRLIDVREEELAAGPPPGAVTFDQVAAGLAAPRRARRWHQALDAQELPLQPPGAEREATHARTE
jgi:hypothetical protein